MIFETFAVGPLQCNCTIVGDAQSGEAIVVDGGDGIDEVIERLTRLGLRAISLIHTHAHIDHIGDLGRLRTLTGNPPALLHPADLPLYQTLATQAQWIGLSNAPPIAHLDAELHDGDVLKAGNVRVTTLHTPGHTPGSVCFSVENARTIDDHEPELRILTGDTLFAGSIGRSDLGGTSTEDIVDSIRRKLWDYDDATAIIPGHGPSSTIGIERRSNPFFL